MHYQSYSLMLLITKKIPHKIIKLKQEPRSAKDIAEMSGCDIKSVIKTLLFVGEKNVIACVPGDKAVDVKKLKLIANSKELKMATEQQVSKITGYKMGGVSPFFENNEEVQRILDENCLTPEKINIGAGEKTVGIELSSEDLAKIWPGKIANISK